MGKQMETKQSSLVTVDSLQKELEAVKRHNIAVLGDGEVFVRKIGNGIIKSVKGAVTLRETNGELAVISNKVMTTAKGFYSANQISSLSIITPNTLQLPSGETVVNPYPIIDEESSTVRKFWVKKSAIGFGPTGNLVMTSATLLYDINMYFIQDLLKKVTYNQGAGKVCFYESLTEDEKKKGIFYKFDGPLGIWADVSHKEILKAIDTFINKKQFAERNAQTICERLVMAKHPALAHMAYVDAVGPEKGKQAKVSVIGYLTDMDQSQLLDLAQKAEKGEEIKIDGKEVEIMETTYEATYEDINIEKDEEEEDLQQQPEQTTFTNMVGKSGGKAEKLFDK